MFMEWVITNNNYRNVFVWMIFNAFPANIMFKLNRPPIREGLEMV